MAVSSVPRIMAPMAEYTVSLMVVQNAGHRSGSRSAHRACMGSYSSRKVLKVPSQSGCYCRKDRSPTLSSETPTPPSRFSSTNFWNEPSAYMASSALFTASTASVSSLVTPMP